METTTVFIIGRINGKGEMSVQSSHPFLHDNIDIASKEAERLARLNPGLTYVVFGSLGARLADPHDATVFSLTPDQANKRLTQFPSVLGARRWPPKTAAAKARAAAAEQLAPKDESVTLASATGSE